MTLLINKYHGSDGKDNPVLFLSDLRLNCRGESRKIRQPFSPPHLVDFSFPIPPSSNDTYAADEVFHHGCLLPFNISPLPPLVNRVEAEKPTIPHFNHRRDGSFDGRTYWPRGETQKCDYQRLRRASSDPRPTPAIATWQKLSLFVFGSMRFPTEMEMKDIRSRQRRRGPPATAEDIGENGGQKSRWRIIRALSCKAADKAPISPVPGTGHSCL